MNILYYTFLLEYIMSQSTTCILIPAHVDGNDEQPGESKDKDKDPKKQIPSELVWIPNDATNQIEGYIKKDAIGSFHVPFEAPNMAIILNVNESAREALTSFEVPDGSPPIHIVELGLPGVIGVLH